ncbi:uncharacterized protein LOC124453363 isoform X1 [Xenia sp. Carnegie-2017]|uniref:uncharacterized protein LOC124453363 isoform X1 n=2 Tax=Xenia sp. Carnegie-2017 TaxID=2897299 RepID=UPI001F03C6ED|nr:uncharacterized protein LOC124453363 isoform X1 [Xenia sp. Carnegie-2017]
MNKTISLSNTVFKYRFPPNWETQEIKSLKSVKLTDRDVVVFGVVFKLDKPRKTRGTDMILSFSLVDQSFPDEYLPVSCVCFQKTTEDMPRIDKVGQIVKMPMRVTKYELRPQLRTYDIESPWLVFESDKDVPPVCSKAGNPTVKKDDLDKVAKLKNWMSCSWWYYEVGRFSNKDVGPTDIFASSSEIVDDEATSETSERDVEMIRENLCQCYQEPEVKIEDRDISLTGKIGRVDPRHPVQFLAAFCDHCEERFQMKELCIKKLTEVFCPRCAKHLSLSLFLKIEFKDDCGVGYHVVLADETAKIFTKTDPFKLLTEKDEQERLRSFLVSKEIRNMKYDICIRECGKVKGKPVYVLLKLSTQRKVVATKVIQGIYHSLAKLLQRILVILFNLS